MNGATETEGSTATARRRRLGIAVGPDAVTVAELSGGCGTAAVSAVRCEDLAELPEALREALGGAGGARVGVALLRPLAHLKALDLPRLGEEDLRRMVERSAPRFFPLPAGEAAVAGVARVEGAAPAAGRVRVLAAACGSRALSAVLAAVAAAGCEAGGVSAGPVAAAHGALVLDSALRGGSPALVLAGEGSVEVLHLERGALLLARSAPAAGTPLRTAEALLRESLEAYGLRPDRVVVAGACGAEPCPEELAGLPVERCPALDGASAASLAALGAALLPPGGTALVGETGRARLRRRQRRRTVVLAGLAAACLALTAGMHLEGLRDRAAAVRERRAAIRPAVERALRARGDIGEVRTRVEALGALERGRPRWVPLFSRMAETLPRGAFLTSLRLAGSELRLEGKAQSAVALVPVFEAAPWSRAVRLGSPVQREQTRRGPLERFSLTLQVGGEAPR